MDEDNLASRLAVGLGCFLVGLVLSGLAVGYAVFIAGQVADAVTESVAGGLEATARGIQFLFWLLSALLRLLLRAICPFLPPPTPFPGT